MTVPSQTPVSNHVGNGVTTIFAYGFKLLDAADLEVSVAGVVKTLNVDYTLTGVGVEAGGTVVFGAAPASLAAIALVRQVTIQRLTDYQYSGDFQSPTVNRDFDRLVMMLQDSGLALANTIRFPPGDPATGVLPAAADRALRGLAFDADGVPIVTTAAGDANALEAQIASAATAALGSGKIGFDEALTYAAGTAGAGIKDAVADAATAAAAAAAVADDLAAAFPVPNANLGAMAAATLKGRASGAGTGAPVDLTAAQARTILNGTAWDLAAGTVDLTKSLSGGSVPAPPLNINITDTLAIGSNFAFGAVVLLNRTGGTGHREALTGRVTSDGAAAGEFLVGAHGYARIQTGSGSASGLNGYAWVDAAASATSEAMGAEMNTDIRRTVVRKVGLQVVDVATSTAGGSVYDAGIIIGRQSGGNNLKYRLKDANGREWVVKIADESQAEVAAVRLLWAIGYKTEIDMIVPKINIEKIGNYKNARFEARPESIKRGERWSWANNPYAGTKEFDGLKLMMALVNNWDIKDDNNIILTENGKSYLVVSDLGSSFGKLADKSKSRTGRSVNDAEDFAKAGFIKGVENGVLVLDYRGIHEDQLKGIKVENARWLADLLLQLSDKQISDAFRAANYSPEEVTLYTNAVKARITALDAATKPSVAVND